MRLIVACLISWSNPLIRDAVLGEMREWLPHETSDSSNSLQSGRVSEELSVTESGQAPEILPDAQAEQALFEPLKVDALIKELGLEVVTTLVKKFLTESAERWNALERGVAAEELATISRESHTLGSSCLTFGIVWRRSTVSSNRSASQKRAKRLPCQRLGRMSSLWW